jgi:hypothetical protein
MLTTNHPFLPASIALENFMGDAIFPASSKEGENVKSFFFISNDITFGIIKPVNCCSHEFCDGQHGAERLCPGVPTASKPLAEENLVIFIQINCPAYGLRNIGHQSRRFTKLFIEAGILTVIKVITISFIHAHIIYIT